MAILDQVSLGRPERLGLSKSQSLAYAIYGVQIQVSKQFRNNHTFLTLASLKSSPSARELSDCQANLTCPLLRALPLRPMARSSSTYNGSLICDRLLFKLILGVGREGGIL